jgi:hypothetical protein
MAEDSVKHPSLFYGRMYPELYVSAVAVKWELRVGLTVGGGSLYVPSVRWWHYFGTDTVLDLLSWILQSC